MNKDNSIIKTKVKVIWSRSRSQEQKACLCILFGLKVLVCR